MGSFLLYNIVFLIGNIELLLGNTFYRIIFPLLAAVITGNKTLLFAKNLVTFLCSVTIYAVRTGGLNIISKISFLCHN